MAERNYNLNFKGYTLELNIDSLPAKSGIYGVYVCVHNQNTDTVGLRELIYIGESSNVKERVETHEKWPEWRDELQEGEETCFNCALISGQTDRERAEAAMIHEHKPTCNTEYVDKFPFDTTTINTEGRNKFMKSHFIVHRT